MVMAEQRHGAATITSNHKAFRTATESPQWTAAGRPELVDEHDLTYNRE